MIIYLSKQKIENLFTEMKLSRKIGFLRVRKIELKSSTLSLHGEIRRANDSIELIDKFNYIIKILRKNNQLLKFENDIKEIKLFSYYYISGKMSGLEKDVFNSDEIIDFHIKSQNPNYTSIDIKCSANNIELFSRTVSEKYRISSGAFFLMNEEFSVELIVWVTSVDIDSKRIIGSPLIISCNNNSNQIISKKLGIK